MNFIPEGAQHLSVNGVPSTQRHLSSLSWSTSPIHKFILKFSRKTLTVERNHHGWVLLAPNRDWLCPPPRPRSIPRHPPVPLCCWWRSDLPPSAGTTLCWRATCSSQRICNTSSFGNGTILVGNTDLPWLTSQNIVRGNRDRSEKQSDSSERKPSERDKTSWWNHSVRPPPTARPYSAPPSLVWKGQSCILLCLARAVNQVLSGVFLPALFSLLPTFPSLFMKLALYSTLSVAQ